MKEERLNNLFKEIRAQEPETSIQDVEKWVAMGSAGAGTIGILTQLKLKNLLTKKGIIMLSSFISILVVGVVLINTSNFKIANNKEKPQTIKKETKEPLLPLALPVSQSKPQVQAKTGSLLPLGKIKNSNNPFINQTNFKQDVKDTVSHLVYKTAINSIFPTPKNNKFNSNKWIGNADGLHIDTLFSKIKAIEINSNSCDLVSINAYEGDMVKFHVSVDDKIKGLIVRKNKNKFPMCSYEIQDSVLKISYSYNNEKVIVIMGNLQNKSLIALEVPKNININVKGEYGDVKINGLKSNYCTVETSSGDVTLNNINAEVKINSSLGDVILNNLKSKFCKINVNSGDVTVKYVEANMDVISNLGDISLYSIKGPILLKGSSGDLKLDSVLGNISAKTSLGDISLKDITGDLSIETSSGDIKGQAILLNEAMYAKTGLGNIDMQLNNKDIDLSYDLKANLGDIDIKRQLNKVEGKGTVLTGKGKIKITGITSSGDQVYK